MSDVSDFHPGPQSDERRYPTAVVFVFHGTRSPLGVRQSLELFNETVKHLENAGRIVADLYKGFLELAQPSFEETLQSAIAGGNERIIIVPVMLFDADHVKRDIPAIARHVLNRFADHAVSVYVTTGYGASLPLQEIAAERGRAALAQAGIGQDETAYVFIARGTSDQDALAEVELFYSSLAFRDAFAFSILSYFAVAKPTVEEALTKAAQLDVRAVLVQPYLLFEGYLTNSLRKLLSECRQRWPQKRWLQAETLWPSASLASLLAEKTRVAFLSTLDRSLPQNADVYARGKSQSGAPFSILRLRS